MDVELNNLESSSVAEPVALVKQLLQRVETLEAENASLKEQLRASKRAAAPFSKGKPNPAPKKPGRRAGVGRFERRAMPVPGPVEIVDDIHVPLDSPDCPRCGASLEVVEQAASVEDTLVQPVRRIQRFRVENDRCDVCKWTGHGQHGATAHRTGSNVIALALAQHYHRGLLLSKVPEENLSTVEETKSGPSLAFTRDLMATLSEAIKGWQDYRARALGMKAYQERGARIRQRSIHQLGNRRLKDTDHQRLLDGIGRQHERGQVLLCLEHPEIEPTNNRAEPRAARSGDRQEDIALLIERTGCPDVRGDEERDRDTSPSGTLGRQGPRRTHLGHAHASGCGPLNNYSTNHNNTTHIKS